ncbi:hypothetical protein [Sporosarcina sp. Marseille-Q4943]|nr:hypothetical protein [Sporosarcina sp. Marseille-Q4943]
MSIIDTTRIFEEEEEFESLVRSKLKNIDGVTVSWQSGAKDER